MINFQVPLNFIEPPGFNPLMRWHILYHIIKENNYKNMVEVGTADGKTTYALLKNLHDINIISIDPYKNYIEYSNDGKARQNVLDSLKSKAYKYLYPFIKSKRCKMIEMMSHEALNLIENTDIVFIDGNHLYEYVKTDIKISLQKIRKGGCLCGHDYKSYKGVTDAVNELSKKYKINFCQDYFWYTIL